MLDFYTHRQRVTTIDATTVPCNKIKHNMPVINIISLFY